MFRVRGEAWVRREAWPAVLLAAAVLNYAVGPAIAQEQRGVGPPPTLDTAMVNATRLDSLLRPLFLNRMTDRYVAGAVISIVHDGRIVYLEGFGDREVFSETPVDPERTVFRIGSITKVLTGIAVMQLVERGLIDVDAEVNSYLSDLRVPDTFGRPILVRHLLTHTAGFDQIGLDRHARRQDAVVPLGDWLKGRLVRIRPPGEVSAYDTYGVCLAGHLVESVSGLEYEAYLRRNIFEPIGMGRSGITVTPLMAEDVATGYGFAGEWEAEPWEYMNTAPASTVNATAEDMARLAIALLADFRSGSGGLLDQEETRAMLSRQFANDADQPGYGFLWFEDPWNGVRRFSHGGSMAGFAAYFTLVPDDGLGVFIAANQESSAITDFIIPRLFAALYPGAESPRSRPADRDPDELARFVGTYANNVYHHGDPSTGWRIRPFEVKLDSTGTRLIVPGGEARAVGPRTFERRDGQLVSFGEDEAGVITHMFIRQNVYERLAE